MNPEDKALLDRLVKVSEENQAILLKLQRTARRAAIWGFIKVLIIWLPLVLSYFYFQPFIDSAIKNVGTNAKDIQELLNVAY